MCWDMVTMAKNSWKCMLGIGGFLELSESWDECWLFVVNVVGNLEGSKCVMGLVFEIVVTIENQWAHERETSEIWSSNSHSTLGYYVTLFFFSK